MLKTYKPPQLDTLDQPELLDGLRQLVQLQDKADKQDPDVHEETLQVEARDGHRLPLRVFRSRVSPQAAEDRAVPLVVLYFGGGFVLGTPTSMADLARSLVKRFNAIVVAPTYRLAPEYRFPTSINDGDDTMQWIAKHAVDKLRADPKHGFVLGGVSAGANLTNVITHLARDRGMVPPITGNWLSVAGIRMRPGDEHKLPEKYRARFLSRTQDACVNSGTIGPELRKLFDDSLKPDINSELYAPMYWPSDKGHKDMPKT